ncbi:hypothetical protein Tco_1083195 [Tanacetum coccineum]
MEEERMYKRIDLEREREEQEWQTMMDHLNEFRFLKEEESMDVEIYNRIKVSINFLVNTQESVNVVQPSSVQVACVKNASVEPISIPDAQSVPASVKGPGVHSENEKGKD